jgi:hypothetical protein
MRELYTYEISTIERDGLWRLSHIDNETFTRDPKSIARALLERWIIGNHDKLTGGERILVYGNLAHPEKIVAKVRVQVYRGGFDGRDRQPVAVAYLGHADSDFPSTRQAGRLRRRLRLPRQRHASAEDRQLAGSAA